MDLAAFAQDQSPAPLADRVWFEVRTPHFTAYSCGPTQEVAELEARLEQFRAASGAPAGAQTVASPPVVVMAFPDRRSLRPFLPLYRGKPANLAAFFQAESDENLIVLNLSGDGRQALASVFHEYSHLLLRQNDRIWPMWFKEGMAEIYSTFEVMGDHTARIGAPLERHLRLLSLRPRMPLAQLLAVTHDSPEYNERDRQGVFYAESWCLAHYLIFGENAVYRPRLAQFTALLRAGQPPVTAFTNAFRARLDAVDAQLARYLDSDPQASLDYPVKWNLRSRPGLGIRRLAPAEIRFRLGDELLRIDRLDEAEAYFSEALRLAPEKPEGYEGLGLLAAKRGQTEEALRWLGEALARNSRSYLAHYAYARERLRLAAVGGDSYTRLDSRLAREIWAHLQESVTLMPDFGPGHHLLGFLELVQGEDLPEAAQQLEKAIQLEPDQESYVFSLAQVQLRLGNPDGARRSLESLRFPYVDAQVRLRAENMLGKLRTREGLP